MSDQQSADFPLLVSRNSADAAIGDALRLYVGRGRRYSVKQLSNATGVKDRTIECAMCAPDNAEHRSLTSGALLSIAKFLGPAFTNEWLHLAEQEAAHVVPADHDHLARQSIEYASKYARARSPDSPGGIEIVPKEAAELDAARPH